MKKGNIFSEKRLIFMGGGDVPQPQETPSGAGTAGGRGPDATIAKGHEILAKALNACDPNDPLCMPEEKSPKEKKEEEKKREEADKKRAEEEKRDQEKAEKLYSDACDFLNFQTETSDIITGAKGKEADTDFPRSKKEAAQKVLLAAFPSAAKDRFTDQLKPMGDLGTMEVATMARLIDSVKGKREDPKVKAKKTEAEKTAMAIALLLQKEPNFLKGYSETYKKYNATAKKIQSIYA